MGAGLPGQMFLADGNLNSNVRDRGSVCLSRLPHAFLLKLWNNLLNKIRQFFFGMPEGQDIRVNFCLV